MELNKYYGTIGGIWATIKNIHASYPTISNSFWVIFATIKACKYRTGSGF